MPDSPCHTAQLLLLSSHPVLATRRASKPALDISAALSAVEKF